MVAGDIFDNSTPSNKAQEFYYRFLCKVAAGCCRHIVIIGVHYNSPSFLNAPKELLALNVHVVGASSGDPADEVIVLTDSQDNAEAIVCAVPYLRDRDIRTASAGESIEEKREKLISGIRDHYAEVCDLAQQKQQELGADIPIIATGHLFTSGGKTIADDGVRDLYVGSLAHVGEDTFPACIDYLGLGHLHVPQRVGKTTHMRYSGSPIPCGYGEAKQEKKVVLVDFGSDGPIIEELPVPCFQPPKLKGGIKLKVKLKGVRVKLKPPSQRG